ncbi:hypothetical protein ACLB1S_17245 [Escherichia coli]
MMIIFLASHMDAVAYTMAATSTRNLQGLVRDPDRGLRLFWCVEITLIHFHLVYRCFAGNDENHRRAHSPSLPRPFTGESRRPSLAETPDSPDIAGSSS